jgi:hypothetical protein
VRHVPRRQGWVASLAAIALSVVLSAPAEAIASFPPSTIRLVRGTTTSTDPIVEVSTSDDVRYSVTAAEARGVFAAHYIAIFENIGPPTPSALFLDWEGQAQNACEFKVALYDWRNRRFVVGASGFITGSDRVMTLRATPARRYIQNGKVRARITCVIEDAFDLRTDALRLIPT